MIKADDNISELPLNSKVYRFERNQKTANEPHHQIRNQN